VFRILNFSFQGFTIEEFKEHVRLNQLQREHQERIAREDFEREENGEVLGATPTRRVNYSRSTREAPESVDENRTPPRRVNYSRSTREPPREVDENVPPPGAATAQNSQQPQPGTSGMRRILARQAGINPRWRESIGE